MQQYQQMLSWWKNQRKKHQLKKNHSNEYNKKTGRNDIKRPRRISLKQFFKKSYDIGLAGLIEKFIKKKVKKYLKY
jgi:hypothetical protein